MRPHLNYFTRRPRPPVVGDIAQQLRDLPAEAAPPYDFAEFQRRVRERSAPSQRRVTWPHAAAAAGLTAFVAAMALIGTHGGPTQDDSDPAPPAARAVTGGSVSIVPRGASVAYTNTSVPTGNDGVSSPSAGRAVNGTPAAVGSDDDPSDQARAAREWLARQPAEPALVRAGSRLAVASLEDRIAWFDDALTDQRLQGADPAQLRVLQQERARLVSSLAQVRFAEALVANGS
jgi:hypothetical protein